MEVTIMQLPLFPLCLALPATHGSGLILLRGKEGLLLLSMIDLALQLQILKSLFGMEDQA